MAKHIALYTELQAEKSFDSAQRRLSLMLFLSNQTLDFKLSDINRDCTTRYYKNDKFIQIRKLKI